MLYVNGNVIDVKAVSKDDISSAEYYTGPDGGSNIGITVTTTDGKKHNVPIDSENLTTTKSCGK